MADVRKHIEELLKKENIPHTIVDSPWFIINGEEKQTNCYELKIENEDALIFETMEKGFLEFINKKENLNHVYLYSVTLGSHSPKNSDKIDFYVTYHFLCE